MTHMKDLIGITRIKSEITSTRNTQITQVFLSNNFAEVIDSVLEKENLVTIKQVDITPLMTPEPRTVGFVG